MTGADSRSVTPYFGTGGVRFAVSVPDLVFGNTVLKWGNLANNLRLCDSTEIAHLIPKKEDTWACCSLHLFAGVS